MPLDKITIPVRASSNIVSASSLLKDSRAVWVAFFYEIVVYEIVVYKAKLRRKVPPSDSRIRWFKYPTFRQWNPSPSSEFWHYTYNCITALLVEIVAIYETSVCSKRLTRLSVRHNFVQFTRLKGFNSCTFC